MRKGVVFSILGIAWCAVAVWLRGLGWFYLWPALTCLLIAVAYFTSRPEVFGKRRDGRMALLALLLHAPYVMLAWCTWFGLRWSREPACNEISRGMWIGRRL